MEPQVCSAITPPHDTCPQRRAVYLIDHTGLVYLMGRAGEYLGFFPPGTSADRMIEIIRQHLPVPGG
jgi:protein SCO1/2